MKIKNIGKGKLKKITSYVLVTGMLLTAAASAENYVIQRGDTLTGISKRKYGTISYYDEIAFINGIENPSYIRAGQVIYLPDDVREFSYYNYNQDYGYVNNIVYYEFGNGDTLWKLAKDYYGSGTYWKPLAYFNHITNPRKIRNGTVIMIPPFSYLDLRAMNMTFEGDEDNKEEIVVKEHTFGKGDTLWKLASENYGKGSYWKALAIYNNISDPKKIVNGYKIYLPPISVLNDINNNNYDMDLYTMSKTFYGTSKYAYSLASYNNILNYGLYNPNTLVIPSLDEIEAFYNSNNYNDRLDGFYIVRRGDTIEKISMLVYEDESYVDYLLEVNEISKKDLYEGMALRIPNIKYSYHK